jgi:hypothetical protein
MQGYPINEYATFQQKLIHYSFKTPSAGWLRLEHEFYTHAAMSSEIIRMEEEEEPVCM